MNLWKTCEIVKKLEIEMLFEDVILRDSSQLNALMHAAIGNNGLPNFVAFNYLIDQRLQLYNVEEKVQGLELIGSNCILKEQYEKGLSYLKRAASFTFQPSIVPWVGLSPVSRRLIKNDWAGYKHLVNTDAKRLTYEQKICLIYQAVLIQLAWRKKLDVNIAQLVETAARIANGGLFNSFPFSTGESVVLQDGRFIVEQNYCSTPVMDPFHFHIETDTYFKLLLLLFEWDKTYSMVIDAPLVIRSSNSPTYLNCLVMEEVVFHVTKHNRDYVSSFENCVALLEWLIASVQKKQGAPMPIEVINKVMGSILRLVASRSSMQLPEKDQQLRQCLKSVVDLWPNILQLAQDIQKMNVFERSFQQFAYLNFNKLIQVLSTLNV